MKPLFFILILAVLILWVGDYLRLPPEASLQNGNRPALQKDVGLVASKTTPAIPNQLNEDIGPDFPVVTRKERLATPSVVKEVLNTLFAAYGNLQRPCPRIEVVPDGLGPRYRESAKTIVLDRRSLKVCRDFGKDSLSALAFIIGHELAHFFQEEPGGYHRLFHKQFFGPLLPLIQHPG